jgi:mannose-6-phosphate isomerase-like protein (cupin superfamily)
LSEKAAGYTIKNLREVTDVAAEHGLSDFQQARFPNDDLDAEATGLGLIAVQPGQRQPFAHRHDDAEEIYVVISGAGKIKLDDEVVDIGPMDAIRMSPGVGRMIEAGPDGVEVLAFGPRHKGDAEILKEFWEE